MKKPLALGAALAAVLAGPFAAPPTAHAADDEPAASYLCHVTGDPKPDLVPVAVTFTAPPRSVTPGEVVRLVGTISITYTDTTAMLSKLGLSSKAGPGLTALSFTLAGGSSSTALTPVIESSGQKAIGKPFTLTSPFTIPEFPIPDDASGEVSVLLPTKNTLANTVTDTPAKVAFTTQIAQDSLLQPVRSVACWLPAGNSVAAVLKIPVSKQPAPAPGTSAPTSGGGSAPAEEPPAAGGAPADAAAAPVGAPVEAPPAADAPAAAGVGASPTTTATALQSAAIPPSTTRSGTFIGYWQLLILGALLPAAALALAWLQRRRLKRAMAGL